MMKELGYDELQVSGGGTGINLQQLALISLALSNIFKR